MDTNIDKVINTAIEDAESDWSLSKYDYLRITELSDIPDPEPIITIGGEVISTRGGITAVGGQAKAGKSALMQPLIAGAIALDPIDQFEGLDVVPSNGQAVIYIDLEQTHSKHKKAVKSIIKRAGLSRSPEYFLSYNFLTLDNSNERQAALKEICEYAAKEFGGIHLIVLDGLADFIDDVNDAKEATAIVNMVQAIATHHMCALIGIIHLNPAPNGQAAKERGHLGSHLQRKAESLLQVSSNGDVSTLEPKLLRNAGKGKVPLIQFSYDPGRGYHVFTGHRSTEKKVSGVQSANLREWADKIMGNGITLRRADVIRKLEEETQKSFDSCKKYFDTMVSLEIIKKTENGYTIIKQGNGVNMG